MIDATTEIVNALEDVTMNVALLVNLPDDGATNMKLTDSVKDITFDGVTYKAGDDTQIVNGKSVGRDEEISIDSYEVSFGEGDLSAFTLYSGDNYVGQTATIYLAFLDSDGDLLASDSVIEVYKGVVHSWAMNRGFVVKLSNHWAAFEVANGRYTNQDSQDEHFSGDTFFEYSHMDPLQTKWGMK